MNKLSAQNIIEEQVKNQLQAKIALVARLEETGTDLENVENLKEDIAKLKEVYTQLKGDKQELQFKYPKRAK
jgi:uncharacterized protein (UPF0335 family)